MELQKENYNKKKKNKWKNISDQLSPFFGFLIFCLLIVVVDRET